MDTTDAFAGLACTECGATGDSATWSHRCPECDGLLEPIYEYDEVDLSRETLASRRFESQWRYRELLPFTEAAAVTANEGATPLVEAPELATDLGVDRVLIKDEGRNPTGTVADRGLSVATTAARQHDATTIALPTTGNGGQSASAYAGVAGLDSHVVAPSRTGFTNKAMINVHGGEMSVVEGRLDDAIADFEDRRADEDWYSVRAFETPYRHEGAKTLYFEIVEQLDWAVPDAVVYPTGHGTGVVGMANGARAFADLGLVDEIPALYAAQADGCAPVARAIEEDRSVPEPWQQPDTICGDIEVADPLGGERVLDAIRETDGGAVSTEDERILNGAVDVAQSVGIEPAPATGAAVSGAIELAERGTFDADDTVVLVSTAAGTKESDVLRSHLMRRGV